MKFAHFADCHLGGWRQPELNALNFKYFQKVILTCIEEKVDFILIAGDLFDSPYPSIDTLKETFKEFRKLKDAKIPAYIIAGSHDYSVSGKTFLDVLEKAGFCVNVAKFQVKNDQITLLPTLHDNIAIYGYPGRKSGLEVEEIEKAKLEDTPGFFKILMLHTTLRSAVPNPKVRAVDDEKLPEVNYLALGHLHVDYCKNGKVYAGPVFPNNLPELEELKCGSFYIFNNGKIEKREVKLNKVAIIEHETTNTLNATSEILSKLEMEDLNDKIVIVKLYGIISQGKISDIDFKKIEELIKGKGGLVFLKNSSRLALSEPELTLSSINAEDIEAQIITKFKEKNQTKFNSLIIPLMRALQIEKIYDEKSTVFEERLMLDAKKIIES